MWSPKCYSSSGIMKWQEIWFFYNIMALVLTLMWCYDPCPDSYRQFAAPRRSYIPENEIEKAFQKAEEIVDNKIEQERCLANEGRVVNTRIRSPESTHPQSFVNPEVREKELRQMTFQEASIILTKQYKLTPPEVCCVLPKVNLSSSPSAARAVRSCLDEEPTITCDPSSRYRTADGTCNNLKNPTWGSALSCFNRLLPAVYSDNEKFRRSVTGRPLPPPRTLSLKIHYHQDRPTDYVNHLYMFFGQLLDHDITFTSPSATVDNKPINCCPIKSDNHHQCAPIKIYPNDPFYSRFNVTCLNFVRAALCDYCKPGPRTPINQLTAFVDASFVYGNKEEEMNNLADRYIPGNLRVQKTRVGDLLPPSDHPENDHCSNPDENQICFQTGDVRANQHPALTSLHTLFLREHNRVARGLRKLNKRWNGEKIFQEARKIVGAEMQVITYGEYLSITLGDEQMDSYGLQISNDPESTEYNENLNPGLAVEFSGAAFRFGHTLINSLIAEIPAPNEQYGHLLRDVFSYPFGLYTGEMDTLMRGATRSSAQYFDRHVVPDVRNYMYRIKGKNVAGFDLPAANIQRGRDLGLPPYVELVKFCTQGETVVTSFDDLYQVMLPENVDVLRRSYRDVHDVDLFVGILLEKWEPGAVTGRTAICINGMQFNRLKYGDRFYFENDKVFSANQRQELKKVSLARLLCDNTGIKEMQEWAMLFPSPENPVRPCHHLRRMELTAWWEP